MPQEPKKRHSRARQGKRRHAITLKVVNTKHKLTHFYALLEKERLEKEALVKQPKSAPAASPSDEE